jgi:hypothetical protein
MSFHGHEDDHMQKRSTILLPIRKHNVCEKDSLITFLKRHATDEVERKSIMEAISTLRASGFNPDGILDHYKNFVKYYGNNTGNVGNNVLDQYRHDRVLDLFSQLIENLRRTKYDINVVNETTIPFDEVVWSWENRNGEILFPPEVKLNINPGNSTIFTYPSCLTIKKYAIDIYIAGELEPALRIRAESISEVNDMEEQVFGQSAMCSDTWHIHGSD